MIADSALLSTSPWQTDHLVGLDNFGLGSSPPSLSCDLEFGELESNNNRMKNIESQGIISQMHSSTGTASECSSDDLYLDNQTDGLFDTSADLLTQSLLGYIDTPFSSAFSDTVTLPWEEELVAETMWSDTEVSLCSLDLIPSRCSSPEPSCSSTSSKLCNFTDSARSWSSLSESKKLAAIDELREIISRDMGVRERMEVMRILNPSADLSHTNFVIDLTCIDDERMAKVEELVRKQESEQPSSSSVSCCGSPDTPSKPLTKTQRRNMQREARQRQRKEYRQMMKEKRSGLFKKEQVLSLTLDADDSSEDVDILA